MRSILGSSRRWTCAIVGAALAVAAALVAPAVSHAAADDESSSTIRWSVKPSGETGADGRNSIESTLDPGGVHEDFIAVRNLSDADIVFDLMAADGYFTRTGKFDILPGDEPSVAAGTWIDIEDSVSVPAGETVIVPFTITVPERAEPGDHAAGITASILTATTTDGGATVGVESRVGVRVITRVTGELSYGATVTGVVGTYDLSWNPLRPGDIAVTFDVTNTGNTRILAVGTVSAGGQNAPFPAGEEKPYELLPGNTRTLTVTVPGVWPSFVVPTTVNLEAIGVTMDGTEQVLDPVQADATVWAMPWPQLMLLMGLALIVGAILWGRRRSHATMSQRLEEAREEGRRAASLSGEEILVADTPSLRRGERS